MEEDEEEQKCQEKGIFDDATNNFGQEGTPAFTRAASPLSQLSFDDEPSLPVAGSQPTTNTSDGGQEFRHETEAQQSNPIFNPVFNPVFSRVIKSASETNFRSAFDYDEVRTWNTFQLIFIVRLNSIECVVFTVASLQRRRQSGADSLHQSEFAPHRRRSNQHGQVCVVEPRSSIHPPTRYRRPTFAR